MINLEPYQDNTFEFFQEVVSRKYNTKGDPGYKDRLEALEDRIETLFNGYLDLVNNEDLEALLPHGFDNNEKADLLSLYKFKSAILQELKIALTTIEGRKFNTCQMCGIEPVGSFDHIVPKEDYPEYSANPINLFPSCLNCNSIKGRRWIHNGNRMFLNLFFDVLPNIQYLNIEFQNYPVPDFSIDGAFLDDDMETLIKSHYESLGLFTRYRENSNEVIDQVVTLGRNLVPNIGIGAFRTTVQQSASEMQLAYGINHWKSLLQFALVNHNDFSTLIT